MAKPLVFISYKHQSPWSEMAGLLHLKLKNVAPALGFDVYIDKTMEAGLLWRAEIEERLDGTTHFIAMLCDPYWDSQECLRELHWVLKRYEAARSARQPGPRLLFVRSGELDPRYFTFDEARQQGVLSSTDARINKLSDVNFLGPFDLAGEGRLEILDWDNKARLDRQLGQLRDRFKATL